MPCHTACIDTFLRGSHGRKVSFTAKAMSISTSIGKGGLGRRAGFTIGRQSRKQFRPKRHSPRSILHPTPSQSSLSFASRPRYWEYFVPTLRTPARLRLTSLSSPNVRHPKAHNTYLWACDAFRRRKIRSAALGLPIDFVWLRPAFGPGLWPPSKTLKHSTWPAARW